jgi:hypothetical protein
LAHRFCDICGRTETQLPEPVSDDAPKLQIDHDGLWVCHDCSAKLVTTPVSEVTGAELPEEIRALVGKSAGAICSTLNLPYEPPFRSVIEAAHKIAYDQDMYMSAWSFVTQWLDGTTVWRAEEASETAIVTVSGTVRIETR